MHKLRHELRRAVSRRRRGRIGSAPQIGSNRNKLTRPTLNGIAVNEHLLIGLNLPKNAGLFGDGVDSPQLVENNVIFILNFMTERKVNFFRYM